MNLRNVFNRSGLSLKKHIIYFIGILLGFSLLQSCGTNSGREDTSDVKDEPFKAYNIDYNWGPGGAHGFAAPGLWADADPARLMDWYEGIGCNVVHSFGVSCNGYAWYKDGIIPEQPGLKHDFLPEMVKIGREKGIKIMAYFCMGANNKWEEDHPDLTYQMDGQQIPYTTEYIDYVAASIKDVLEKADPDGIMLDWFYNPGGGRSPLPPLKWIECEKKMYPELMDAAFLGKDKISREEELQFRRAAIERAWQRIKTTVRETKPDCIIWLTAYEINSEEYQGTSLLKEVDWIMNEAGDIQRTEDMRNLVRPGTQLITTLAAWNKQDPVEIASEAMKHNIGLYGFTKPVNGPYMKDVDYYLSNPVDSLEKDERNIAVLARVFNNLSLDYIKKEN